MTPEGPKGVGSRVRLSDGSLGVSPDLPRIQISVGGLSLRISTTQLWG